MSNATLADAGAKRPVWRRAFQWWLAQVRHTLPAVIFFFVGFNLILWTQQMVLGNTASRSPDFSRRRSRRCSSEKRCSSPITCRSCAASKARR